MVCMDPAAPQHGEVASWKLWRIRPRALGGSLAPSRQGRTYRLQTGLETAGKAKIRVGVLAYVDRPAHLPIMDYGRDLSVPS
jgi:hypothetical protein